MSISYSEWKEMGFSKGTTAGDRQRHERTDTKDKATDFGDHKETIKMI
ncbi:hypothetical protein [Methanolobus vulcani]|nr:hypothetical protein [Methanolobus vulcani]